MPIILACRRWNEEYHKFTAILGYVERSCHKKKKKKKDLDGPRD
jgi:hypothetical protein